MEVGSLWTQVGHTRFHARVCLNEHPQAPSVVFVHGLGVSSRYMVPTLREVGKFARAYAPDLPGFGRTTSPARPLDIAGLADALASWMESVGLPSAALVGNSVGCQVVAGLAVRQPARVAHLALIGPTMDRRARSAVRQIARLVRDVPRERPSLLAIAARDYLRAGPMRAARLLGFALRRPIEADLGRVSAPVLLMRGDADPISPQGWVAELATIAPAAQVLAIEGAAHAANYSHGPALAQALRDFLGVPGRATD